MAPVATHGRRAVMNKAAAGRSRKMGGGQANPCCSRERNVCPQMGEDSPGFSVLLSVLGRSSSFSRLFRVLFSTCISLRATTWESFEESRGGLRGGWGGVGKVLEGSRKGLGRVSRRNSERNSSPKESQKALHLFSGDFEGRFRAARAPWFLGGQERAPGTRFSRLAHPKMRCELPLKMVFCGYR